MEAGAACIAILNPDAAAMSFYCQATEGQPQAEAARTTFFLNPTEFVEDRTLVILSDTVALIWLSPASIGIGAASADAIVA